MQLHQQGRGALVEHPRCHRSAIEGGDGELFLATVHLRVSALNEGVEVGGPGDAGVLCGQERCENEMAVGDHAGLHCSVDVCPAVALVRVHLLEIVG
ncbi:MAG TPA: hypothetical protein VGT98_03055, partial [Candidatus Elarobacter sp.]|nr:hypothetical protein [Candidatus Elarobacter sp.]